MTKQPETMTEYMQAGYCKESITPPLWSSSNWMAFKAGEALFNQHAPYFMKSCRMSRGYSVIINEKLIVKFTGDKLETVTITAR